MQNPNPGNVLNRKKRGFSAVRLLLRGKHRAVTATHSCVPSCNDAELASAYGLFPAASLYFWCFGVWAVLTINMVTSRFFCATWA